MTKKIVHVDPSILDSVLRDPFEPMTYFPNELIQRSDVSRSALGLLLELAATEGVFDVEAARAQELKRRSTGLEPEDVDELLSELETAGFVSVTEG
ncbi:hypothetical protein GCM10010317_077470 [Streptomyces mirabilis]|uniref:hypothetical protein n=1 Tax=Streptomyces mirabilis TaxID=68239 RepID=UPI00167D08E5|nr:hypothetical protein [Streptomyces mirabilis]GHD70342.1 hypothetical protein GCM10010317_077470 [Streptomyces mirabilis]